MKRSTCLTGTTGPWVKNPNASEAIETPHWNNMQSRMLLQNDMQSRSSTPPPPPTTLRSGQIQFLVPEDTQCSKTYAITILAIFFV